MGKGTIWPAEKSTYFDRVTNVQVTQLTDYYAHSHHLYFTENGWYHNQKKLLFLSDRNNATNLYSVEIESGEITQLTDLKRAGYMSVCLHPSERKAFFTIEHHIHEIELDTLKERRIYSWDEQLVGGNINCTADGQSIITCVREDLSKQIVTDLGNGYVGHREMMAAKPRSQIIKIDLQTSDARVVFTEENFITHINTSPTHRHLITYCHEGPWQLVDHRIWGLNLQTGEVWKIRERTEPYEKVGHEYWHQDGETIGYHGFRADGTGFFGKINYDNSEMDEVEFSFKNWHAQSNDFNQIVVDGKGDLKHLIIWGKEVEQFTNPKVLCEHRCSFHSQKVHAHPRFTPDGKYVLFTSDKNGYGNLYMVELPADLNELPDFK